MKNFLLLIFISLLFSPLFAQIYKGENADKIAQGADIVRLDNAQTPSFIHFNQHYGLSLDKALIYSHKFFQNGSCDFILNNVQKNNTEEFTYRYIQTYNNIPIEFTAWYIQVRRDTVYALNGKIIKNPQVDNDFVISSQQALNRALGYVNAEKYMWEDENQELLLKEMLNDENASYYPVAEKVIVPNHINFSNSELRSAYKFNIFSLKPYKRMNVYVDASNGEILLDIPLLYDIDTVGTAYTQYNGVRQIHTDLTNSQFRLRDNTRGNGIRTLDCNLGTSYSSSVDFTDADNVWNNVNSDLDQYATDAHFAAVSTYDYYLNKHQRNSIDGNGFQLWSYVHFNLVDYGYSSNVNAFWNGTCMTYGDGNDSQTITPLTSIDICGHEITHGLTSYTCNLTYQGESGALNEAFSDIFGSSIEFYVDSVNGNWLIGEDIGYTMRSLANPNAYGNPDTYQGTYWVYGDSDNGGVHTNMGPLCYWFYLLCVGGNGTNDLGDNFSVNAIGRNKAEQIAFRVQTVYLSPSSNYDDVWFYGLQAAADLYGACSDEVESVGNAFYAIGVMDEYVDNAYADFAPDATQSCAAPFEVTFNNNSYNGDSFLWDFGDGTTSTLANPSHTYSSYGMFDVQLIVNSQNCNSDTLSIDNLIIIDESLPCNYLMPTSGLLNVEACNGFIFDCGGENGVYENNTSAFITIHSPNADHIQLTIIDFDIEPGSDNTCDYDYIAFYDGIGTSGNLINNTTYCNTTGNPNTINSTGEYITIKFYSDGGLTLNGFKIRFDCVGDDMPPTSYFDANKTNTCDGIIQFSDQSLNNPTSWLWNFGDGTSSTEQHPLHVYTQSGVYSVTLTASNSFGSNMFLISNYVNVDLEELPEFEVYETDFSLPFSIDLGLDGSILWFENEQDTTPVFEGSSHNFDATNPSEAPLVFYVRELFEGDTYSLGETASNSNGGFFGNESYIHFLVFDAYIPFILNSVEVNAQSAGFRNIALRTSDMEVIDQISVYCPAGVSRINLNMSVPAGTDLQLVALGAPYLYRTNEGTDLNYPYTIFGIASITGTSASDDNYYYYFYDWEISTPDCLSESSQVVIVPTGYVGIDDNSLDSQVIVYPNPNNGIFTITSNNELFGQSFSIVETTGKVVYSGNLDDRQEINISHLANGVYFVIVEGNNKVIEKIIKM